MPEASGVRRVVEKFSMANMRQLVIVIESCNSNFWMSCSQFEKGNISGNQAPDVVKIAGRESLTIEEDQRRL